MVQPLDGSKDAVAPKGACRSYRRSNRADMWSRNFTDPQNTKTSCQRRTRPTAASASLEPLLTHSELLCCREENKLCVRIPSGSKFKSNTRAGSSGAGLQILHERMQSGMISEFYGGGEKSDLCPETRLCSICSL